MANQHQFPLDELRQTIRQTQHLVDNPNLSPEEVEQYQADLEQLKRAAANLNQKLAQKRQQRGRQ